MAIAQPRRPTPAQRKVLEHIRDGEIHYNYLSPRRSGIPAPTFAAIFSAGWIEQGDYVPSKGKPLSPTNAGRVALAEAVDP